MFKKIKEFFAAEKYEEKPQESDIRPEYKDNLGICSECGWVFKLDDGKPIVAYGMHSNLNITNDEIFSIVMDKNNKLVCENCILLEKQRAEAKELNRKECEKLAGVLGLETETVIYFVNKLCR